MKPAPLTVSEVIDMLSNFPGNTPVLIDFHEDTGETYRGIRIFKLKGGLIPTDIEYGYQPVAARISCQVAEPAVISHNEPL